VVIPPYISNATLILKGTSIASIITVTDITATATSLIGATYRPFELLGSAAAIYIALNTGLAAVQSLAEKRLAAPGVRGIPLA
jgi:ABC-type amino acid transport system permease subunit